MRTIRTPLAAALLALGGCYAGPPPSYPPPQEPYNPPPQQVNTNPPPQPVYTNPPPQPVYTTPAPQPEYTPEPGGEYVSIDAAPPEEAAPTVDVFYDSLAPYGSWQNDTRWGRVWYPQDTGYQPYHRGYWQNTD